MEERKHLLLALILFFITSFIGFYLTKVSDLRLWGSKISADYEAEIKLQREIELKETYLYNVKGDGFRMLFRSWRVPLTYKVNLNVPFVKLKGVLETDGYDWYVKDFSGKVYGDFSEKGSKKLAKTLAGKNEVGIVEPNFFKPGRYALELSYAVYPPVEVGRDFFHLNLKLADRHPFYEKVKIKVDDPKGVIEEIYPHVTNWKLKKKGSSYIITGFSPSNENLGVELLFRPISMWGFPKKIPEVKEKTEKANGGFFLFRFVYSVLNDLLFASVLLYPLFFYLLYLKFGREKEFVVPSFLSYVPNPERKPYQVNLLFSEDAAFADENAFYSTILDFMRRGIVEVKEEFGSLAIKLVREDENLDDYESSVINFIKAYGLRDSDGKFVLDLNSLKNRIEWWKNERKVEELKGLKEWFDKLMNYSNALLTDKVLDRTGLNLLTLISFGFFTLLILLIIANKIFHLSSRFCVDFYPLYVYLAILTLNGTIFLLGFPSQLLGRWKENYYREKLMWDAFKNFLSDFAAIKKYAPKDVSVWKEWLVYGTALGVADKVEKALKELSINIPEIQHLSSTRHVMSSSFSECHSTTSSALSSSSSSGSFGSSGGFGGGGAGAR